MSAATPARLLALKVTAEMRQRDAYAHNLIEKQVHMAPLSTQERAFAIVLILGVAATSGELDLIIGRLPTKGKLHPKVHDALRISTYELLFLGKEPHIAVNQGVELVRTVAPFAAGFANKMLKQIANMREAFPFGDPQTDDEALAHQYAFPLWLARRLIADLGRKQAAAFMSASNTQAPVYLAELRSSAQASPEHPRQVTASHDTPDSTTRAHTNTPPTIKLRPDELSAQLPRVATGELIIADASAQEVARLATPAAKGAFLEVGSGRGTKTVLLQHNALAAHGHQAQLIALDVHAYKAKILADRAAVYHLEHTRPVAGDILELDALTGLLNLPHRYSGALIDAPCSGTGTLRRHPEIRWHLKPESISAMAKSGLAMLAAVSERIAPGGFIVYATCSVLAEENERVVEGFLATEKGAAFTPTASLPSQLALDGPDAHFAVKLQRKA
ncbi:MAG: hypothetical protein LBS98_08125 [Coriobacteriales bacterium]|nr:hypothetical protein [Coriobacteriales bacterium]